MHHVKPFLYVWIWSSGSERLHQIVVLIFREINTATLHSMCTGIFHTINSRWCTSPSIRWMWYYSRSSNKNSHTRQKSHIQVTGGAPHHTIMRMAIQYRIFVSFLHRQASILIRQASKWVKMNNFYFANVAVAMQLGKYWIWQRNILEN